MYLRDIFKDKKERILEVIIVLIPITLIISPFVNTVLLILAFILSLSIFSYSSFIRVLKKTINNKLLFISAICYGVFLGMHLIALLYTENIDVGLSIIRKRLPLYLLPIIFITIYNKLNCQTIRTCFMLFVLFGCVYTNFNSIIELYQADKPISFFYKNILRFDYQKLMLYGIHPPYFGMFINVAIVTAYFQLITYKTNKVLFLGVLLILIFNLFLVSSQMAIITFVLLVLILVFYFIYSKMDKKVFYFIASVFIITFFVALINGESISKTIIKEYRIENSSHVLHRIHHFYTKGDLTRKRNWESGYKVIKDHFVFGTGTGDAIDEMLKYRHKQSWIYLRKANSHNQYIEELARFGIFGFVGFIGFVLLLIYLTIKQKLFQNLLILLILSFAMITESTLNRQLGVVLFGVFSSIIFIELLNKTKQVE